MTHITLACPCLIRAPCQYQFWNHCVKKIADYDPPKDEKPSTVDMLAMQAAQSYKAEHLETGGSS